MSDYTVTLDTTDAPWSDDEIEVEITEPGMLTRSKMAANIPDSVLSANPESMQTVPHGTDILITELITECSSFPIELVDDLPMDSAEQLIEYCSNVFIGNHPEDSPKENSNEGFNLDFDLNDDGTLDLEDYR